MSASPTCSSSHPSGSSSTPITQQPITGQSYFAEMDAILAEFQMIASLQVGERLCQDSGTKRIVSKYDNPDKAAVSVVLKRMGQALQRHRNGDSAEEALQRIQVLTEEITQLVNSTHSPYDFYSNFSARHEKLDRLCTFISTSLQEGGPLAQLVETITTCSANVVNRNGIAKDARRKLCEETVTKVKAVAGLLTAKVEEYNRIQITSDLVPLPDMKTHVNNVLTMLLTPQNQGEVATINVSTHRDLTTEVVKQVLSSTFGEAVVNDVMKLYSLEGNRRMTYSDFQAVVVGIIANLTIDDVRGMLANPHLQGLLDLGSVENEAQLAAVLQKIRTIDLGGLENISSDKPYYWQLSGDRSFLEACSATADFNFSDSAFTSRVEGLKRFGYTEQLSRFYSYAFHETDAHQFRNGTLFPLYDDEGRLVCKEAHHIFGKDAIFCLGVLPVRGLSVNQETMQVVFRGTYDKGSIIRDLSFLEKRKLKFGWEGPGGRTYADNQEVLLTHILSKMSERPELKTLEITGHSLGACDAMRFTAQITGARRTHPALQELTHIKLFGYNGPAIEDDIAKKFMDDATGLQDQVQIDLRYFPNGVDIVSTFGTYFPGYCFEGQTRPSNLNISWIQLQHLLKSHQTDSMRQVVDEGSMQGVMGSIKRRFDAHCHPYFSETCKEKPNQGNTAYVRYFVTTAESDKTLIDESAHRSEISATALNEVLQTSFNYQAYLQRTRTA